MLQNGLLPGDRTDGRPVPLGTGRDRVAPDEVLLTADRVLRPDLTWLVDGAIWIDPGTGRIRDVGPREALLARARNARIDTLGPVLLVPGFVNGHAHTFQSLLRGLADDLDFAAWRDVALYPSARWLTREDLATGALLAYADMLRHGITTVQEFFYLQDAGNENSRAVIEAGRETGIRQLFGRALYDGARAPDRYRETAAQAVRRTRELAAAYREDRLVRILPCPHSPHAASPEMLRAGADLAEEFDTVFPIHVAEGRYETEAILRETGLSPAEYLQSCGALTDRTVLVHAVHLGEADLDRIRAAGARVVHNPTANAFLGDGVAPLPGLRARGIPVCLGTDGGCTNNRLSLLDEMRMAVLLQRAVREDGGILTASEAFGMGTREAATVFRLSGEDCRSGMPRRSVGILAPDAVADIVAIDARDPGLLPDTDPLSSLVYAASPGAVRHVWVDGRETVRDGRVLGVDKGDLEARVQRAMAHRRAATG